MLQAKTLRDRTIPPKASQDVLGFLNPFGKGFKPPEGCRRHKVIQEASGRQGAALHPAKGIIPSALPDLKVLAASEDLTWPDNPAEGKL
ncbi:hypothetical protein JCM12178A_23930 [Salidesulfovibrio brasiliensis]